MLVDYYRGTIALDLRVYQNSEPPDVMELLARVAMHQQDESGGVFDW